MTREYFINKANHIHNNKYDYSELPDVVMSKDKINVKCPTHGEFVIIANNHLNGRGCSVCKNKDIDTEIKKNKFIEKSQIIHGDKYDYSKVKYVNSKTKVCIICKIHGEFWQTPDSHLHGKNCLKCSIENNKPNLSNTVEFINKAKLKHRDEYDYSKVEYVSDRVKVCIICKIHGEFWQTPNSHLGGCGCPKCTGRYKTNDDFINEVKNKFGDIYDFSKTKYIKSHKKITIGYNNNFFEITPSKLLNSDKPITMERVYNLDDFIYRANLKHKNKYDYSKVIYERSNKKVCIVCNEHGEFWQTPNSHLSGNGCPNCKSSILENEVEVFLNKNNIIYVKQYRPIFLKNKFSHKSLDFYLPDYNIAIECQGVQHFKAINYWGGNVGLNNQIIRDVDKYKSCSINNIKLIYYINQHISLKDITDNLIFSGIYNKSNSFKKLDKILKVIK
jgi:predicted RNA-binding protein YlxR (DUF448 family)